MNLLRLNRAEVSYGEQVLLDRVEFNVADQERIALVGRNGAGKSTLLKVLAGQLPLDDGERWLADEIKLAYLDQSVPAADQQTIYQTVFAGLGTLGACIAEYHNLVQQDTGPGLKRLDELQTQISHLDGWNIENRVSRVLQELRLDGNQTLQASSGGIRRRTLLAQALIQQPDILLLDEPTNHMDIQAIEHLQNVVLNYPGTVIFVSHDRALIDATASQIVELDRGQLRAYPGNYQTYLRNKTKADEEEATADKKFDKVLAQEEAWIRQGIKARRTRNEGRVRRLKQLRKSRAARLHKQGHVKLQIEAARRSGDLVIQAENVSLSLGGQPILSHFNSTIRRGDRVGIIGANGSGKSSLIRLLLGEIEPDSGAVRRGTHLQIAYFDQQRTQLNPAETVRQNIADGADHITINGREKHVVGYLADFLFSAGHRNVPAAQLSGGEKNRLLMAKLFAQPANVLVLDEPTNDLDVETLELMEELLMDFGGTVLLVSHDRSFLDAVVTSTLVFENGRVNEYVGGYADWQKTLRQKSTAGKDTDAGQDPDAGDDDVPGNRGRPGRDTPRPSSAGKDVTGRGSPKPRLTYNDQRELEQLPDKIEALELEVEQLQQQTSNPEFYRRDPEQVKATLTRLAELNEAVAVAYTRWETLSNIAD